MILILFIVLLLFGARRLPDMVRSLGKIVSEFNKGKDEALKEITSEKPEDKRPG